MYRRANADEGSHGADQRRKRDKERESRVDVVAHACQVVSHLMCEQDQHETRGEGNSQKQASRVVPDSVYREKRVAAGVFISQRWTLLLEVVLKVRSDDQGG